MNKKFVWVLLILLSVFGGIHYSNNHMDRILSLRAENAFKKNDISKAQEYLEKAFDLGLADFKQRDVYINSIINSPLDIKAQERLVKFINYPVNDAAKLKAEYFLYDLKREIYKKYPQNYIAQTVYNQKVMRWGEVPVKYSFINTKDVPEYFTEEIENAFSEWEKASGHQILFTKDNKNPNIIINFKQENPADEDEKKYVVAFTAPIIENNKLKNTKIEFYLKDPLQNYYSPNQVYNTALHELVHALGFMGHSDNKENIMYLTKDTMSITNDLREDLTEADINTVKLLYKIKPEITNIDNANGEYLPYLILGNEEEVYTAKIKEAKTYIHKAPNIPSGYIDLAESYAASKDYPKAIKNLEKALELADTDEIRAMVYYNLAVVYYYIDHTELAKEYLQKSMEIKETDEMHYILGTLYAKEGNNKKAIEEYNNLIAKNPKNIEYTIALTNIYITEHKYMSARKVLKNFFKNNPSERNNPRFESYGIVKLFL